MPATIEESLVRTLARRFADAVAAGDEAALADTCTPGGRGVGETPTTLYYDARQTRYALAVAGEVAVEGERAAVGMELRKDGRAPRALWLLAETVDGRLGLAGVNASPRVVRAFLRGEVAADVTLRRLPPSPRAAALGEAIVAAAERHGRVADALGREPMAAMVAGMMLDGLLASPGTRIAVAETRELASVGRAAVRLEIRRPELSTDESLWLVLELTPERAWVRATASAMTLEVLLGETTRERTTHRPEAAVDVAPAEADAIDALLGARPAGHEHEHEHEHEPRATSTSTSTSASTGTGTGTGTSPEPASAGPEPDPAADKVQAALREVFEGFVKALVDRTR